MAKSKMAQMAMKPPHKGKMPMKKADINKMHTAMEKAMGGAGKKRKKK